MKSINYRELKRRVELDGLKKTTEHLSEAIDTRQIRPEEFSLRDLAEALIPDGLKWVRSLDPCGENALLEGEGVESSAFLNITGRIISTKIREAYEQEAFKASKLVSIISSRLSRERIPGIGRIQGGVTEVAEGMPYPNAGFSEEYVDTPETAKHGLIVPVTREAIFFDQTGLILKRASEVGEILGADREKRILDMILGLTNTYSLNGNSFNTYYESSESSPWVNKLPGNELSDWRNVDAAEQLFATMCDDSTGLPLLMNPNTVLVMPGKRFTAAQIFYPGNSAWSNSDGTQKVAMSNLFGDYALQTSAYAYQRLISSGISADAAAKYWFMGDFKKAFAYVENWGLTVSRSVSSGEANFTQDILVRFKASERGVPAVLDPRCVVCCTG
ncbi:MAG: hypothetical protein E7028_05445 [Planctomycetaceae bacterium]|nr:hypothetical protein [Planctomycetaceae bacterium]